MLKLMKRKYPRFTKDCEVRFKVLEMEEMPHHGRTVNISGGGLRFRSDVEAPLGKMLTLEIDLPEAKSTVVAMGKVVWAKKDSEAWEIAVEFWWLGYRGEAPPVDDR